jgi:intergrase/recombinase
VALSKYLGIYRDFSTEFKNHGIRWTSNDNSFSGFLRIINNNHNSLLAWFEDATSVLEDNERLFLKYLLLSGLRKSEAITSFNMIVELGRERLSEYYDSSLSCLCHFKYPIFLRKSKNIYVSPITTELLNQIAGSKTVSYSTIRKKLNNNRMKLRLKECRSYYATYLRNKGIMAESIDLVQGRVGKSVFVQHYLKLNLAELSKQILAVIKELESSTA